MRNTAWVIGTLACVGMAVVVCGESHGMRPGLGGGPGAFNSGIAGTRMLSGLSYEETVDLCLATGDYMQRVTTSDSYLRRQCILVGAATSETPEECEAGLAACIEEERMDAFDDFSCGEVMVLTDCHITVDEFETCLQDAVAIFTGVGSGATCSITGDSDALMMYYEDYDRPPPASCTGLESRCPGFEFGGSSSGSGSGSGGV